MIRHLRAIATVLSWPCTWHFPGDDECLLATWKPGAEPELVWAWATRIPRRFHGVGAEP